MMQKPQRAHVGRQLTLHNINKEVIDEEALTATQHLNNKPKQV